MGKLKLIIESENINIYSPQYDEEELTEFEKFIDNYNSLSQTQLRKDYDAIIATIDKMRTECGARENLFRLEGGNIKAIPLFIERRISKDIGTLRLYCIRLSDRLLIIGNGGIKKVVRYEDDPILLNIVEALRKIEHSIYMKVRKQKTDYEDFETVKNVIDTIII